MISMMDRIIKDYGWCQVIRRDNEYIIRYDAGGIAVKMIEARVSKEEADRALVNQSEAEKVIIELQKRSMQ